MKKIICHVLCFLIIFILCVPAVAKEDPTVLDLTDKPVNSSSQFSKLEIKTNMQRGGNVSVNYTMTLNDDYLLQQRNSVEEKAANGELEKKDFPIKTPEISDNEYKEAVDKYNDEFYQKLDNSVLPKIQVNLTYDKTVFEVEDMDLCIPLTFRNSYDEKEVVGEGEFSKDFNGNIVLTCTFNKIVYNRSDVEVSFSLDYILWQVVPSGKILRPVWVDDRGIISAQVTENVPYESSVLSESNIWIIVGVAVVAVAGVVTLAVIKRKRNQPQ